MQVQLNKYKTAPYFFSIKPKLDMRLFFYFCVLYWICLKVVLNIKTEQFYVQIRQIHSKTQKLTNNCMSSFGLIEKNMELSQIYSSVHIFKLTLIILIYSTFIHLIVENCHNLKEVNFDGTGTSTKDTDFLVTNLTPTFEVFSFNKYIKFQW